MAIGQRSAATIFGHGWLNYFQAMEILGVSRSTLDGWRKSGLLVFAKLHNGQLRIRHEDLNTWLEGLSEQW